MTEDEFADKVSKFSPLINDETMFTIEKSCQDQNDGINRRILLSVLTMDGEKLTEACETEAEAFFEAFRCSADTLGKYKRLVRLLDKGHHRLMVGLCSVDWDSPDAPFTESEFFDAITKAKGEDIEETVG